jgi:hypothetical protein
MPVRALLWASILLLLSPVSARGSCAVAGGGGYTWAMMYGGGCMITSNADANCIDDDGGPGNAYMDIQHEVSGPYGVWAMDYTSGSGGHLLSCINSTGAPQHCYYGNARLYIADMDTPDIYMDDWVGLSGECCGGLWDWP